MKKLLLILLGIFIFTGCTTKVIVKKDNTIQQKQDANKAWKELDKEN